MALQTKQADSALYDSVAAAGTVFPSFRLGIYVRRDWQPILGGVLFGATLSWSSLSIWNLSMSLDLAIQLVDQKFISAEQFVEVIRRYESERMSEIAVVMRRNMMTTREARRVIEFQAQHPDKTFCEIAVCLGLLNATQVREIQRLRIVSETTVEDILIDLEICKRNQIPILNRLTRICRESVPSPKFSLRRKSATKNSCLDSVAAK